MKTLIMSIVIFMASFALAEDTPFVNLLGYSDDGQWMAFQETVVRDGSGNFDSAIRVLDTKNDRYYKYSDAQLQDEEMVDGVDNPISFSNFTKRAQAKAKSILNEKGIKVSNGQQVMVATAPNISSLTYKGKYVSLYKRELDVTVSPESKYTECNELYGELIPDLGQGKLLGYSVEASNADSYKRGKVLHADNNVPKSRGCPQAYSINSAMAYGDQVTLMISVKTFGFEGPDIAFITVPFNINEIK